MTASRHDLFYIVMFLLGVGMLLYVIISSAVKQMEACEQKGGVSVKTASGYECVKLERIPLDER